MREKLAHGGDDCGLRPRPGRWYRRIYPSGLEYVLRPFFAKVVHHALPTRAGFGRSLVNPESINLNHRRLLRHEAQQNAARLFHRLQFNPGGKAQPFAQRFRKDDSARFVHTEFHGRNYAIRYGLWQNSEPAAPTNELLCPGAAGPIAASGIHRGFTYGFLRAGARHSITESP